MEARLHKELTINILNLFRVEYSEELNPDFITSVKNLYDLGVLPTIYVTTEYMENKIYPLTEHDKKVIAALKTIKASLTEIRDIRKFDLTSISFCEVSYSKDNPKDLEETVLFIKNIDNLRKL